MAQDGAPWADGQQPRRPCCQVRARARGRAAGVTLGLDASACARSGRARHSPQCQHMAHAASRSGATHTKLVPPRPHASDARDARAHRVWTARGPRARAWPTRRAVRPARAGPTARAAAPRCGSFAPENHPKLPFLPTNSTPYTKKSSKIPPLSPQISFPPFSPRRQDWASAEARPPLQRVRASLQRRPRSKPATQRAFRTLQCRVVSTGRRAIACTALASTRGSRALSCSAPDTRACLLWIAARS